MAKHVVWSGLVLGCLLAATPAPAAAQNKEKVFLTFTPAQVEKLLADMDIQAKKSAHPDPKIKDTFVYSFERMTYGISLSLSRGTTLWISASFPKTTLEKINEWNINAKFSRAVLVKDGNSDSAVVEYQMDVRGGVTENMFKQFIRRFDNEVSSFEEFLKKG